MKNGLWAARDSTASTMWSSASKVLQVSARTGLQQRFYTRHAVIDRKNENLSSPPASANLARHFDGADEGQQVVNHNNVWLGFEGFEDRLVSIGGFGDDLPVRADVQHFPQRGSDHLMFIGNENAGHLTATFTPIAGVIRQQMVN